MPTQVRDIADRERLEVTFRDTSGNLANPTTVVFRIRTPDGATATASTSDSPNLVINQSTGVYYYDYTYSQAGRHFIEIEGVGALVAAVPGERYVRRSNVT